MVYKSRWNPESELLIAGRDPVVALSQDIWLFLKPGSESYIPSGPRPAPYSLESLGSLWFSPSAAPSEAIKGGGQNRRSRSSAASQEDFIVIGGRDPSIPPIDQARENIHSDASIFSRPTRECIHISHRSA